ncbi:MAG: glutamine--tRNA ligase/YqeY domain fusion protein [Alphaproteobacteria bacterium]|nr:glutamine--tRNA ligase/YqeY domain fusion protein [Alphaproteobacteria bacterium]
MSEPSSNFVRQIVSDDLREGRCTTVVTRFPPEPNGYLHIGHAKAICLGFGIAAEFGGRCHLRMDDTNPEKEDVSYVRAIQEDIRWLGFDWGEHLHHASDWFERLFDWAKLLIRTGKAYVDEQTEEQIRTNRGTVETPGVPSPWRNRPASESLDLFDAMNRGDFPDGAMVLRAKIDMGHPNMKMRDPLMYRIRNVPHHHAGDRWRVYPFYDWAHGQSDALEGITHSLCTLEFDNNRELYDWFLDQLPPDELPSRPHQYEFARLNLAYTVMSKRLLHALVREGHVDGWDDPRMPTIAGYRRRGYTPASIRDFVERVGVSKAANTVDPALLDACLREDLDATAPRVMVVLDPLPVTLDGAESRVLDAPSWPHDAPREGSRPVPFGPEVLIERADFEVEPPPGFKRLAPGRVVRLRHAGLVRYVSHELGPDGAVARVRCEVVGDEQKPSATLHWVCAADAVDVRVNVYDRLFLDPAPGQERDFRDDLNPASLRVVTAKAEPSVLAAALGSHLQFERVGFFYVEPERSTSGRPVFNRVVPLKDARARSAETPVEAPEEVERTKTVRTLTEVGRGLVARGLSEDQAQVLQDDASLRAWFDQATATGAEPSAVAGYVVTELPRLAREHGGLGALRFGGGELGALAELVGSGRITSTIAKQVLAILATEGGSPAAIVEERGLAPIDDRDALAALVAEVLADAPDKVAAWRGGRTGLHGFFVGQVMQRTGGRADAVVVRELVTAALTP